MDAKEYRKVLKYRADVLSQLRNIKSIDSFLNKGLPIINKLGFSDIDIMKVSATPPHINFISSSLPKTLFQNYMQEAMCRYDIIPDVLIRAITPIYRSTIYEHIFNAPYPSLKFDKNRTVNELWINNGYNDCYYMPLDLPSINGKIVISILGKNMSQAEFRDQVNEQRIRLEMFYAVSGETLSQGKFFTNVKGKPSVLHEGDSDILKAFCIYGTAKEVADYLGLEISTINNKVSRIKKTLYANSIASAIYTSIKEGFIE